MLKNVWTWDSNSYILVSWWCPPDSSFYGFINSALTVQLFIQMLLLLLLIMMMKVMIMMCYCLQLSEQYLSGGLLVSGEASESEEEESDKVLNVDPQSSILKLHQPLKGNRDYFIWKLIVLLLYICDLGQEMGLCIRLDQLENGQQLPFSVPIQFHRSEFFRRFCIWYNKAMLHHITRNEYCTLRCTAVAVK